MRTPQRSLTELDIFCEVARKGGLRRAALSLGLSVSTVSVRLQELETRVDRRLFHRNTRSLALTEAGTDLFAAIEPPSEASTMQLRRAFPRDDTSLGGSASTWHRPLPRRSWYRYSARSWISIQTSSSS